jgi:type I restriction enzyme S subunit
MSGLPRGWVEANLAEISEGISYGFTTKSSSVGDGARLLRITDIQDYKVDWASLPFCDDQPDTTFLVRSGDIVVARTGATTGKSFLIKNVPVPTAFASYLIRIAVSHEMQSEYVWKFMQGPDYWQQIQVVSKGTAQPGANAVILGQVKIPVSPLAEQKRIVGKLDVLSVKSARARTELARIETLVSRYKQAVLSKAFSGESTSAADTEARSVGGLGYPPHWRQMHLGEIADIKSGIALGKKRKLYEQLLELPYLRVANVQRGWLDLREIKTVEVTAREAEALLLHEGDVLMNEGGDRDKLGRGWVWDGQIADCIHQNHVFRVRLVPGTVPPRFLSYYANEFGQKHFFDEGKQTTNLASISKSKLSAMQIPVPPFEEAKEIVCRIESAFAKIDRLAGQAKRALELVGKLDEAILAKAFRGELVHQDENDEPASSLLEKIKLARMSRPLVSKSKARTKKGKVPNMANTLLDTLVQAKDWLSAQELFARCGVRDGSSTEDVEKLYRQLLDLERQNKVEIDEVVDLASGAKQGNRVRLRR